MLISVHSLSPSRQNSLQDLKPNSIQSGVRVDAGSPLTKNPRAPAAGQPHFVSPFSSKLFLHRQTGSSQISDVIYHVLIWHRGEILVHIHGYLILTSLWQKMYRAETYFSLICTSRYLETRTYVRITHPATCATCIALCPVKQ